MDMKPAGSFWRVTFSRHQEFIHGDMRDLLKKLSLSERILKTVD
jgi:hypothetical protein